MNERVGRGRPSWRFGVGHEVRRQGSPCSNLHASVDSSSEPKGVSTPRRSRCRSLPTRSMRRPGPRRLAVSAGGKIGGPTWAISWLRVDSLGLLLWIEPTAAATALSDALCGGRAGWAARRPRCAQDPGGITAWASTVGCGAVNPATSFVLCDFPHQLGAHVPRKTSSSSTSRAMDTPSFVMVGAPNFLLDDDVAAPSAEGDP